LIRSKLFAIFKFNAIEKISNCRTRSIGQGDRDKVEGVGAPEEDGRGQFEILKFLWRTYRIAG